MNDDGCDTNCLLSGCGNTIVNEGEQCDDGNDDNRDDCISTCRDASCGDGFVQRDVELCDDGNDRDDDACPALCAPSACGDGHVRIGEEECDDGNDSSNDECLDDCTAAVCGDGFLHFDMEECDLGDANGYGICAEDCTLAFVCGDADSSGLTTAVDGLQILLHAVGGDVACPPEACDVNRDGRVVATDALMALQLSVDLDGGVDACGPPSSLLLRLQTTPPLGALQVRFSWRYDRGYVPLIGGEADCEPLIEDSVLQVANTDRSGTSIAFGFLFDLQHGKAGPFDIARCRYIGTGEPSHMGLVATVTDASTPLLAPVLPIPEVVILPQ